MAARGDGETRRRSSTSSATSSFFISTLLENIKIIGIGMVVGIGIGIGSCTRYFTEVFDNTFLQLFYIKYPATSSS